VFFTEALALAHQELQNKYGSAWYLRYADLLLGVLFKI
jgi:hypothetical protein